MPIGKLKEFVSVVWSIPFYSTAESRKVMPILAVEMNDLNPDRSWWKKKFPGANPFFHHCSFLQYYVACRNGQPVGRIAAFIDRSYHEPMVHGEVGWIGLFESFDDDDVASALLGAATDDLQQAGAVKIIGPARFNANGEDGLLVDGFDKHPMVMEPYQPPYYTRFLEQWGVKENDWYAFRMTHESASPYMERLEKHAKARTGPRTAAGASGRRRQVCQDQRLGERDRASQDRSTTPHGTPASTRSSNGSPKRNSTILQRD